MEFEIERKFLLKNENWRREVTESFSIRQGYLVRGDVTVRVRIAGDGAFLTLKKRCTEAGFARMELQYPIPVADGEAILKGMCQAPVIEKTRHIIPCSNGLKWEIDEFSGHHAGLILAEIELPAEDAPFPHPEWLGEDVTNDSRYYNSNLQ